SVPPPTNRLSITRLRPTAHPNCWRAWANTVVRACASASSGSNPKNTPTWRTCSACCAFNAAGQATAPPRIPRNSRRLMRTLARGETLTPAHTNTLEGASEWVNVRYGSEADICAAKSDVRFTPNSDRESGLPQTIMSALSPIADMWGANGDVGDGPITDITLLMRSPRWRARARTAGR